MISAFHAYAAALYPVVGQTEAFAYEASLATVFEAMGSEEEAAAQQAHRGAMVDLEAAVSRGLARLQTADGS